MNRSEEIKMILEILKKSKTPLMAKNISFLLYQSYNGYKLHRKSVRDILWNELKSKIKYDKNNFTYELKNQIESIHEDVTYLIEPLKYKLTELYEYKKQLDNEFKFDKKSWIHKIKEVSFSIDFKEERDEFKILKASLGNPFYFFSKIIDPVKFNNNIHFQSFEFQKIFDEVTRDNIITQTEKDYLIEKGVDFGVESKLIKKGLKEIDFKGYNSFKLLIDEICEDGIITEVERRYINEKAKQYNVDSHLLDQLITLGLKKVSFLKTHKKNNKFFRFIQHVLVGIFLGISFKEDITRLDDNNLEDYFDDEVKELRHQIVKVLNDIYFFEIDNFQLDTFLQDLDIDAINIQEADEKYKQRFTQNQHDEIEYEGGKFQFEPRNKTYKINDKTFIVKQVKMPYHPLFIHEVEKGTGKNVININTSHKLYSIEAEDAILNIAVSLSYSKLSMTDPNVSRFIDKMNHNLNLIENGS